MQSAAVRRAVLVDIFVLVAVPSIVLGEHRGGRALSNPMIAGYDPATDVVQHSRIDLDQKEMEFHLGALVPNFTKAEQIYSQGGNSGGRAKITVSALAAAAPKGARVTQAGNAGAVGYLKSEAFSGSSAVLEVTYSSSCKVGGSSSPDTLGCYSPTGGNIFVDGNDVGAPVAVETTYRTLAGFSMAAESKMAGQEFYAVYKAYYGRGDYAHKMVMDALTGTGICVGQDNAARVEVAKKTSALMNLWMYVIREMEDAIMDCQSGCMDCNDDPVHAWDEAVAFYAGSLEGADGSGSGKLLHQLADKRCSNFETCESGSIGGSRVNTQILEQFKLGQAKLMQSKCVEAVPVKRRIVELMSVPLLQGALRYAYKVGELSGGSKEKGEGAAFSAAILPLVAACDADAARLISDNLRMDASTHMSSGFAAVKQAFESTYACLGITCEDVGGLANYDGAEACVTPHLTTGSSIVAVADETNKPDTVLILIVVLVSALLFAMCGIAAAFMMKARKYKTLWDQTSSTRMGIKPEELGAGAQA